MTCRPAARLLAATTLVLLAGCASTVPEPIRTAPTGAPELSEVRAAPEEHRGAPVRWGGMVLGLDHLETGSRVEILARPLETSGRPREGDRSAGRFMARFPGFIDPAVVTPGRAITVVGSLNGTLSRTIDAFEYTYPVVEVTDHHLWAPRMERHEEPIWRDPWYDHPFNRPPYVPYYPGRYW
ncbi:MAG: Slp family lipoprotein [Pseudomonadota bacterium]